MYPMVLFLGIAKLGHEVATKIAVHMNCTIGRVVRDRLCLLSPPKQTCGWNANKCDAHVTELSHEVVTVKTLAGINLYVKVCPLTQVATLR